MMGERRVDQLPAFFLPDRGGCLRGQLGQSLGDQGLDLLPVGGQLGLGSLRGGAGRVGGSL